VITFDQIKNMKNMKNMKNVKNPFQTLKVFDGTAYATMRTMSMDKSRTKRMEY
jgi:hypothetical protein